MEATLMTNVSQAMRTMKVLGDQSIFYDALYV